MAYAHYVIQTYTLFSRQQGCCLRIVYLTTLSVTRL